MLTNVITYQNLLVKILVIHLDYFSYLLYSTGFGQAEYVGPAGKSSVEASVMSDSDSVVETKKVEETKDSVANENTTDNKE